MLARPLNYWWPPCPSQLKGLANGHDQPMDRYLPTHPPCPLHDRSLNYYGNGYLFSWQYAVLMNICSSHAAFCVCLMMCSISHKWIIKWTLQISLRWHFSMISILLLQNGPSLHLSFVTENIQLTFETILIKWVPLMNISSAHFMNRNASSAQYKSHPICRTCLQRPIIRL